MMWINKQRVLLWDTGDKRGWLVSGLTALLHLVRASLHRESSDIFSSQMLFKPELLHEPSEWIADATASILVSKRNLNLKIYDGEAGTFGDRVETFYNILEKMIDYQNRISGDEGAGLLDKPRGCLEGWDFHDIMMNSDDRMFPRATTLEQAGRSWVDLVRVMSAVTLFGRGFGQLIRPSKLDVCKRWTELPPGKFYIAVPLLHLQDLINNHSSSEPHTRLGRKLIWHTETNFLEGCRCDDDADHDAHEPVQSLIPLSMSRDIPPRQSKIPVSDSAIVIFGHHSKSLLVWNDFGSPTAGTLSADFESGQPTPFSDSGIETSSKSATARETGASTPSVQGQEGQPVLDFDESSSSDALRNRDSYTVGIICALHRESLVVRALLDKTLSGPDSVRGDTNVYAFGRMGRHLVVSACLPAGNYGNNPAVVCAENMRRSFENLQFCFLVGVGGGIPSPSNDVRLGDVVVSQGIKDVPAVIQYDRGKENDRGVFERTGSLSNPPTQLLGAISHLQSDPRLPVNPLETYVEEMISRMPHTDKTKYRYPGSHLDSLLQSSTGSAGSSRARERVPRLTTDPVIHYGPIASGNKVIKSAEFRDKVAQRDGVLCFDMEAAGVAETFPALTLVVRGICDYSDAQKNKDWQDYAAANAAAYVKLLLSVVPVTARSDASSRRRAHGNDDWEDQPSKRLRMGSWKS
jgi:nucleoside phosphorylase